jgi:RimJ/RimL family protein N-acetyltransferase
MGTYPITTKEFQFVEALNAFTAYDENEIVGFFTLRKPNDSVNELRIGFVIVDPAKRGKGFGKEMMRLGIDYAFNQEKADVLSLGVFENNLPAYYCYKSVGFKDVTRDEIETYEVLGEVWICREMRMRKFEV